MRRIKSLGLGALMALALTAFVGAGSASASFYMSSAGFTTDGGTKSISGSSKATLGFGDLGLTVNCKSTSFNNPEVPSAWQYLVLPTEFGGCLTEPMQLKATVDTSSCILAYKLSTFSPMYWADAGIGCIDDKSTGIKVNIYFQESLICAVTIPRQWSSNGKGAVFSNNGKGVNMTQLTEGMAYTASGSLCEGVKSSNGSLSIYFASLSG